MREDDVPIKLLTFNTWGLKFVSSFRKERLEAIANRLSEPNNSDEEYDIVALQEVWCEEDWNYLSKKCQELYPYNRIFKSGIISGPGLAILSKIPIDETFLYRFPINGRSSAFFRGDWFVGKSVAITLLKPHTKDAVPLAILNSHMHAPYGKGDSSYSCHRACQAWDLSKMVKLLKRAGYAVILVGDLNSKPNSLPYKLFTIEGELSDSWEFVQSKNYSNDAIALMDPSAQVELGGVTCDSQLNTWRANRNVWEACRLDYALIDSNNITPISASVKFTERLPPPLDCSYSDHFAYATEFLVATNVEFVRPEENTHPIEKMKVYRELMSELEEYRTFTIPFQATWRKWHLISSVLGLIFLNSIAIFATGPLISPFLMFLSTIIGITGTVNGLIWYCGVRSESRALQEVQLEVDDQFTSARVNTSMTII